MVAVGISQHAPLRRIILSLVQQLAHYSAKVTFRGYHQKYYLCVGGAVVLGGGLRLAATSLS